MHRDVRSKAGHVLNPQGNLWAKDDNRFGLKIMQKMGWTAGKGLGKDEQGIKEHIKTAANLDQRGLGFKVDGHAFEHSSEYESILSSLSEKYSKVDKKCEMKLKNKHRYLKMMNSKNVKLYSKKDLNSIFLKREKSSVEESGTDESLSEREINSNTSLNEPFVKKSSHKKCVNEYFVESDIKVNSKDL